VEHNYEIKVSQLGADSELLHEQTFSCREKKPIDVDHVNGFPCDETLIAEQRSKSSLGFLK
jgi:hypothetical protein